MENDNSIAITHFINPHLFWYKYIGLPNHGIYELKKLEQQLQELYKDKPSIENRWNREVGEKVAVNFAAWNKYIRGEVLQKIQYNSQEYIVWATDYGFPFLTKNEYIRKLPDSFKWHIDIIHRGGMSDIVPAKMQFSFEKSKPECVRNDTWLPMACDMLEKLISDADAVHFINEFKSADGHNWGSLFVFNHRGDKSSVREILLNKNCATDAEYQFHKLCIHFKTIKVEPWLSNDRKNKYKFNTIKHNICEHNAHLESKMINEYANRKVQDWCARNERQQMTLSSSNSIFNNDINEYEIPDDRAPNIDDLSYEFDSVSKIHCKSSAVDMDANNENNYMGKVGIQRKKRQQKYNSKDNLPPEPSLNVFQMNSRTDIKAQPKEITFDDERSSTTQFKPCVTSSTISDASGRLKKLENLRAKYARENKCSEFNNTQETTTQVASSCVSNVTGISTHMNKLAELRRKHARNSAVTAEVNKTPLIDIEQKNEEKNQNFTTFLENKCLESRLSQHEDQNSFTTSTTCMSQNEGSQIKVPLHISRARHLSKLRSKLNSSNDLNQNNLGNNKDKQSESILSNDNKDCYAIEHDSQWSLQQKVAKPKSKNTKLGFEGMTMVPAGFDISRLQTYRDEKNHWHRKKTTRYDKMPHDYNTLSEEDSSFNIQFDNNNSSMSSSSDIFQFKAPKSSKGKSSIDKLPSRLKQLNSSANDSNDDANSINSNEKHLLDLSIPNLSDTSIIKPTSYNKQQNTASDDDKRCLIKSINSSENSSDATIHSTTMVGIPSRRRQLKSPTSQLLKIEQILKNSQLEKDLGNTNILDIKLFNSSPVKPKATSTTITSSSSTTSSSIKNSASNARALIEDRNIGNPSMKLSPNMKNEASKNVCASSNETKNITNSCMKSVEKKSSARELKDAITTVNYKTIMEIKRTECLPIVKGERKLKTKFIDQMVLAHSSIPIYGIEKLAEAPFLKEIHDEMANMRVNRVYRIQVYSWSHVLRGNSLFVVNPSRSGKTWSYLPSLCSLICYSIGTLKPTYGPAAIILVASTRHVEQITYYCHRLMAGLKSEAPSCVASYGVRNFIETKIKLNDPCGILVVTPSSLLRLLHENENLFDPERLRHIVVDDFDLMLSRAQHDLESVLKIVFQMALKTKYKTLLPQLIVTSRDWDSKMVRLMLKSNQPLLLIGDFLEAAVYGRAKISVVLKPKEEKNKKILHFIRKHLQSAQSLENRILVLCNTDEDVLSVMQFLKESDCPCLAAETEEREAIDEWKAMETSKVLICTDARFAELEIQNIQVLIHHSMPTSWTIFTKRFSALAKSFENYVSRKFNDSLISTAVERNESNMPVAAADGSTHSLILLDEDNSLQLPRLITFLTKHNQTVHPDILAVSKRVMMRNDAQTLIGTPLCPQLLEFGECDDPRCDNRHDFTQFDVTNSNNIPNDGELKIHILKVFSPTYFTARLLYHKPSSAADCQQKWQEIQQSNMSLKLALLMHKENACLAMHWPPQANDICIYKYMDNFTRARILEVPKPPKNINVVEPNLKVNLKLIDVGTVITAVKCNELFVCDDKLKHYPPEAVDIRLMNIVPFDNERMWDSKTTKEIQKIIMDNLAANQIVHVNINFVFSNIIFINNLVVMEKLTSFNSYIQAVNLKKLIIENKYGMLSCNGERKNIRDIIEELGLLESTPAVTEEKNILSSLDINQISLTESNCPSSYKSCQNDDSKNLIEFSSSNEDGAASDILNSSIKSLLSCKNSLICKVKEFAAKQQTDLKELKKIPAKSAAISKNMEDENWDLLLDNNASLNNEIYLPLIDKKETNQNEKDDDNIKKEENCALIPKCSKDKDNAKIEEAWTNLNLNELTKVEIGDERDNGYWENLFLQITDRKHLNLFDDLTELIHKHIDRLKMQTDTVQHHIDDIMTTFNNCIVKYDDKYLRAKLHQVFGSQPEDKLYRFFLCDYACFTSKKYTELFDDFLYETTNEIVQFIPNQAVHCTLAGVKWDRFTKPYQVTQDYLYACAVQERTVEEKSALDLNNLPIRSYKILLYQSSKENDFKNAEMLNKTLLDAGITITDEDTKHFLDYSVALQTTTKDKATTTTNNKDNGDEICKFEDLIKAIYNSYELEREVNDMDDDDNGVGGGRAIEGVASKQLRNELISKQHAVSAITQKDAVSLSQQSQEEQPNSMPNKANDEMDLTVQASTLVPPTPPLPALKAKYKRPLTTWFETDCMIYLCIHAPDITNYYLEIEQNTIYFSCCMNDDEEYALVLNLLGSVNSQNASHEIKGLNVIVRLVKLVYEKWPRLLQETIKYPWLKYNFNAFEAAEMEYLMPEQYLQTTLENRNFTNDYGDNSDLDSLNSEDGMYETYNPIRNIDDDFDPLT